MFLRILLIGVLAVTLASAQRGGGGGRGRGGGGMEGGGFPMGGQSKLDRMSDALKLNKDQKKELKTALDDGQKEANPIREQLAKARLALGEAIQSSKGDEEVKKLTASVAALESQMAEIEAKAIAKAFKSLEREQASGLFPMIRGIFNNKNWNTTQ